MTSPLDNRNTLALEMLVACDQAYIHGNGVTVGTGMALAPLSDSTPANDAALPYALPDPGFRVARTIEIPETGFKCVIYKHDTRDEIIVAMAGTDGPSAQDWAQNLKWGWLQWGMADLSTAPETANPNGAKDQVFAAIRALSNPATTKINFTGQSLGGVLAEYAAFEYWRQNKEANPDLLSRMTLTTFNGLAGGEDAERAHGLQADVSVGPARGNWPLSNRPRRLTT
jgi:hypothetical protein